MKSKHDANMPVWHGFAEAAFAAALILMLAARVLRAGAERATPPDPASARRGSADLVERPDALAPKQQQIADDYQHLQDVLLRMAELSEATEPRRAALLRQAIQESQKRLIGVQLESLVELLRKGQLSRAVENQQNLEQDLQALLELLLSENRARRVESEKARIREYLKRLDQIINQQKDIQGRTAGRGEPGPLADDQARLAQKSGDLAEDIKRNEEPEGRFQPPAPDRQGPPTEDGSRGKAQPPGEKAPEGQPGQKTPAQDQGQPSQGSQPEGQGEKQPPQADRNPARRRIEAAQKRMREAEEKLRQAEREGAVDKQEEALQELERARAELERILRQLREEEIERMLTALEARFKKMLDIQREVYEGTVQLDGIPPSERTHNEEIQASRLSRREAEIVLEAEKALSLLHDDATAVAFPEALEQAAGDMRQVAERLGRADVGSLTQTIEQEIIAALEEMLEALHKARQEAKDQQQRPTPPGPPQDQPLVDVLSEIKMIRAMQMRVNRSTERYSKLIDGEQARNAELLEALQRLAERQARIHQITRELEKRMGEG